MRVAYISDERFPGWGTDTQQITKNAEGLAQAGAQVELLIPIHVRTALMSDKARRRKIREHYGISDALDIRFLPGLYSSDLRIEKLTHGVISGAVSVLRDYDVVYTRNVLPTAISVLGGSPTVFENHRVLREHYPVSYQTIKRLLQRPNFLGVIANCKMVGDAYLDMGLSEDGLLVSHLGYDPADFEPRLSKVQARENLGWPTDKTTIVYTGHIGKGKGMEALYDIALRMPETDFRIVGGTPSQVEDRLSQVAALGAKNVHHSPFVRVEEVPPYLYAADVMIVPPTSVPLKRFGNTVLPMKLYTYLAAGRPIAAPSQVDVRELLSDGENAILLTPDAPEESAKRLSEMLGDPETMERIQSNAMALAPQYSWTNRGKAIYRFLQVRLSV